MEPAQKLLNFGNLLTPEITNLTNFRSNNDGREVICGTTKFQRMLINFTTIVRNFGKFR